MQCTWTVVCYGQVDGLPAVTHRASVWSPTIGFACLVDQTPVLQQALYRLSEDSRYLVRGCSDDMCCLVSHRKKKFPELEVSLECSL